MQRIEKIFEEVRSLYESGLVIEKVDAPEIIEFPIWQIMSINYMGVAQLLWKDLHNYFLQYAQNIGHSLELALKAYILTSEKDIPHTHDLISLCKKCDKYGFKFEGRDIAVISHLQHFYFKDLITALKFTSRYPNSSGGGSIGKYSDYEDIINRILQNAQTNYDSVIEKG